MLCGNALCKGQTEPRPLLLALAYKRFEQRRPNVFWNSVSVVLYSENDLRRTHIQTHHHLWLFAVRVQSLTGVQYKIVDCAFDLLAVDNSRGLCGIWTAECQFYIGRIWMRPCHPNRTLYERGHQLGRTANPRTATAEDEQRFKQLRGAIDR